MIHRIALAGPICSGKTTAATFIRDAYRYHSTFGFATPLYALAKLHGEPFADEEVADWIDENLLSLPGMTPALLEEFRTGVMDAFRQTPVTDGKNRTLLQRLGTEVGRKVDPNLWTKLFTKNMVRAEGEYGGGTLNDNLRFINEYDCSRDLGFLVVYLDVSKDTQRRRYRKTYGIDPTEEQLTHASERDLPFIRARADFVINNDEDDTVMLRKFLRQLVEGTIEPKRV